MDWGGLCVGGGSGGGRIGRGDLGEGWEGSELGVWRGDLVGKKYRRLGRGI